MTDRQSIGRGSKSFGLAARLLPPVARTRAEALYAWCRAADDRIDHAPDRPAAEAAMAELRAGVAAVYAGRPPATPADAALRRAVGGCGIPPEYPHELLAGFGMDVRGIRYETADELLLYCHRVAGVVGLMMCHALGVRDDAALPHAAHLGTAMQLTNIARDVAADWSAGRLYLPAEWLPVVPRRGGPVPAAILIPGIRRCLAVADRYYESGEAGLQYLAPRCRPAILASARVYRAIGAEIAGRGHDPSAGRAVVGCRRKWGLAAGAVIASLPALLGPAGPVRPPRARGLFRPLPEPPDRPALPGDPPMTPTPPWRDAAGTTAFAVSLTALMAAALFVSAAVNPDSAGYGDLPWYYAGGSLVAAGAFYVLSRRYDRGRGPW